MKPITLLSTLSFLALIGAGCNSKPAEMSSSEGDATTVALFKAGKGILFTDETKTLFGVEMVEVTETPMQRRVQRAALVYREADARGMASAVVRLATNEFAHLKIGQPVSFMVGTNHTAQFNGRLARLDTQTLPLFGEIEALVEFADPNHRSVLGEVLTASFDGESKPALVMPESALLTAADACYVYTVNGTRLTRTCVKVGTPSNGFVAVEDGLYAGDSVAAKGIDNLWLVELSALKGGTPCCPVPKKNSEK